MGHFCGKCQPARLRRVWNEDRRGETGERTAERRQSEIAAIAYSYWEARGRQGGSAEDDWYRAEREWERTHPGI